MNLRIPIYHYICFGLLLVSMFLPYYEYDLYTQFNFFSNRQLIQESQQIAGVNYGPSWLLLILMAASIFVSLLQRSVATAIIALIFGFFNLIYLPILSFLLVFSLFGTQKNKSLEIGFVIAILVVVTYFGLLIMNLVKTVKEKKNPKAKFISNPDILDETDLLDSI